MYFTITDKVCTFRSVPLQFNLKCISTFYFNILTYFRVKQDIKWGKITGVYLTELHGLSKWALCCRMVVVWRSRKEAFVIWAEKTFWRCIALLILMITKTNVQGMCNNKVNRVKSAFMLALNRFMLLPMPIRFCNFTLAHIHSMFLSILPSLSIFPLLVFFSNSIPLLKITGL